MIRIVMVAMPLLAACDESTVVVPYAKYFPDGDCMRFEWGSAVRPLRYWRDEFTPGVTETIDMSVGGRTLEGECLVFGHSLLWRDELHAINDYPDDPEWLVPLDDLEYQSPPCPYAYSMLQCID